MPTALTPPVQEFCSYLADIPHLGKAEPASCKGLVTECKVCDILKQISLINSLGLDSLSYKEYLTMLHMFVPILMDMFNHWFTQGAISGSITKSVIQLLKKSSRHVWEDSDDYRPITLLNTELKILAWVTATFCSLSSTIWLDLSRTTLWREDQSKTTCIWFARS